MNAILIALALSSGPNVAHTMVKSMSTTTVNMDGSYTVHYVAGPKSTHAPKRDAARFTSDEGNNGIAPMVVAKRF